MFKSYNSLGQSDYSTGFTPGTTVEESITLLPLGNTSEALLNEAIHEITGSSVAGGRRATASGNPLIALGSSLQRKAGGHSMIRQLKNLTF